MTITDIQKIATQPFEGQKPGTSGLRKKTKVFQEGYYLHNFIQSLFNVLPAEEVKGSTLLVSGDGRYFNKPAISIIVNIAFANGVRRIWIGKDGLISTPAASAVIREREGGVAYGGIVLTASHNPGGPENDFGIKYNTSNGGTAQEALTDAIFEKTKTIKEFKTCSLPNIDVSKVGIQKFGDFVVEVIDPIEDWMALMKTIFDFDAIGRLIKRKDFSMVYDGLNGVAGPYAEAVFCDELGASSDCLRQCQPMEDFGGSHPDPNLTYASGLVDIMKVLDPAKVTDKTPVFGAAGDGDNDRHMILGRGFFVTPSDSVAIIASYAVQCIPYFAKTGLKGLSRSFPTSGALDCVGKKMGVNVYEVPTGWKYFGNLMEAGKLSICGEESFGSGSDHIREKDGLWAVLSWLSILAYLNQDTEEGKLVTVQQIVGNFWREYGRNYYSRYDYEELDSATKVIERLTNLVQNVDSIAQSLSEEGKSILVKMPIRTAGIFTYHDPIDGSIATNQGIYVVFVDGSRIVWRVSGTGSSGATIRVYFEKYEAKHDMLEQPTQEMLKDLVFLAAEMSQIESLTGRASPTVIT